MLGKLVRGVSALILGALSAIFLGVVGEKTSLRPHTILNAGAIVVTSIGLASASGVWYLVGFRWVLAVLGVAFGAGISARKLG